MRMLMLSVDSSAAPASVCLTENGRIIADYYLNTGFTHSQTLMAMTESVLTISGKKADEIDAYAVNNGPGSFTGVRIGVSAVKGMAFATDKPCIAVSTLLSMAYNCLGNHCIVSACMDARRQQVYNAVFRVSGMKVERLTEDRAIAVDDLIRELDTYSDQVMLVGDGAELVSRAVQSDHIVLAPEQIRFQRAASTAAAALEAYNRGEILSPAALMPSYLRLSQAERERNAKQKGK